jgi:C1A family cysteine protease
MNRFGYIPDLRDARDLIYSAPRVKLPMSMDLRTSGFCPPVWDQGDIGSCTAHGIGFCFAFQRNKQGLGNLMPSRLFIYYNERVIEHTVESDAGAMIRDGIKVLAKQGVPPESHWPYETDKFRERPPANAFAQASAHLASKYERIPRYLASFKSCLVSAISVHIRLQRLRELRVG